MSHIDELFQWLANEFVHSFQARVAQFWVQSADRMGQTSVELRANISQDPALPIQFVVNDQVAATIQRFLSGTYDSMSWQVEKLFASYQANMLARFGVYYCTCSFMRSNMLLPSTNSNAIAMPLRVAVLLYFRQPPTRDTLSAIDLILGQATSISENRFLLAPASTTSGRLPALKNVPIQQQDPLSVYELIPKRNEDSALLTSSNPLSGAAIISDKRARRFYAAVNDSRTVKEICEHVHIDVQEAIVVLKILLKQERIHLYEPGGQPVESSLFFELF
jgi:hypothetical protein